MSMTKEEYEEFMADKVTDWLGGFEKMQEASSELLIMGLTLARLELI